MGFKPSMSAILCVLLAGCVSTGNTSIASQSSSTVGSQITVGTTTESTVRLVFGDPQTTTYLANGDSIWTYDYEHLASDPQNFIPVVNWFVSGANGYKKELVIEFDQNNVVKNYSMTNSPVQTTRGILG